MKSIFVFFSLLISPSLFAEFICINPTTQKEVKININYNKPDTVLVEASTLTPTDLPYSLPTLRLPKKGFRAIPTEWISGSWKEHLLGQRQALWMDLVSGEGGYTSILFTAFGMEKIDLDLQDCYFRY